MASFREYYYDWTADEPATMVIECLDDPGPTPPVTADEIETRLDRAYQQVEDSMVYWTRYMVENRDEREPNVVRQRTHGRQGALRGPLRVQLLGPRTRRGHLRRGRRAGCRLLGASSSTGWAPSS